MKSLQWQQKVGCLKNLGMNLWSFTTEMFFFFKAPFLTLSLEVSTSSWGAISWSVLWVMLSYCLKYQYWDQTIFPRVTLIPVTTHTAPSITDNYNTSWEPFVLGIILKLTICWACLALQSNLVKSSNRRDGKMWRLEMRGEAEWLELCDKSSQLPNLTSSQQSVLWQTISIKFLTT